MELIYILYILLPGLYIYGETRKERSTKDSDDPEYLVLIRGFYASIPMIAVGILFATSVMPQMSIRDTVYSLFTNPCYLVIYFLAIPIYAKIVCWLRQKWNHHIYPWIGKKMKKVMKKNYYLVKHDDIMTEIWNLAKDHKRLIGRVTKDGKEICLGAVDFLPSAAKKQIGFRHQKEYRAYFEDGKAHGILNPAGTYLDMETGYVIDLYDGDNLKD